MADARRVLAKLIDRHLVEEDEPDRHHSHDLLRVYAADRAQADEPPGGRSAAVGRISRWYLHSADTAGSMLTPQRMRPPIEPLDIACPPMSFGDRALAIRVDIDDHWGKGFVLHDLGVAHLDLDRPAEAAKYLREALSVRRAIQDRQGEARTTDCLGSALCALGRQDASRRMWRRALSLYEDLGDPTADDVRARITGAVRRTLDEGVR